MTKTEVDQSELVKVGAQILLINHIISILTDNLQNIPEDVADTARFKTSQSLAVVWDQDNGD